MIYQGIFTIRAINVTNEGKNLHITTLRGFDTSYEEI